MACSSSLLIGFQHTIITAHKLIFWLPVCNELRLLPFSISILKLYLLHKLSLTFNNFEKNKHENFDFVHLFSSSFFLHRHSSKSIRSLQILSIPKYSLANLLLPFLFCALHELRVLSNGPQTEHKLLRIFKRMLLDGLSCNNCVGMARIVTPHLGY